MSQVLGQPVDPDDPWAIVSGPRYSPDNIYTKSVDGHGHTVNIQVPISTAMNAMITEIANWPGLADEYRRSRQNVMRDALAHRVRYLHDAMRNNRISDFFAANPTMESTMKINEMLSRAKVAEEFRELVAESMAVMRQNIEGMIADNLLIDALIQLEEWKDIGSTLSLNLATPWNDLVEDLTLRAQRAHRNAKEGASFRSVK